jgi:primosomal protein N' (replication factor Y)
VLYLLPEIALTHQIIQRLQMVLGDTVGVYHSKYGDAARLETYLDLLKPEEERKYSVILGVRSSVFLPFTNLGLIIVDEEHESSYKQFDPAPRYHARDVSLVLARMHKANVLLGTATPSVETYYNTENGKYCRTELFVRHTEISLPEIITVDTREAHHKKEMLSHFSHVLIEELKTTVANGKQAILFLNRRGFSPYLKCFECGWVPGCIYCDVKLTWHKNQKKLICHYCGHSVSVPEDCMECGNPELKTMGFGTEKIEEELTTILPGIRFGRMDLDTTRSRDSAAKIIAAFESRQIDVLVGTQMISKGLDFDDVLLVGIVNADHMLNFPDFRAHERSFQLMAQVAGRAGRKGTTGKVLIQTTEPEHKIIGYVKDNDFISFYNSQIEERDKFLYPPFVRLIALTVKHKRLDLAHMAAKKIHDFLGKALGTQLGPVHTPLVGRVQEYYLQKMLIRIGHDSKLSEAKALVLHSLNEMQKIDLFKGLLYTVDVDPA